MIYMNRKLLTIAFVLGLIGHVYFLPKLAITFTEKPLEYGFNIMYFVATFLVMFFNQRIVQFFTGDLREAQQKTAELNDALQARSEELAFKNEQLKQSNQIKDQFISNISHELRTPLNGIVGITDFLITAKAKDLPSDVQRNLQAVLDSGQRLSHLVNDILDFSTLRNRALSSELQEINLYEAVQTALEQIKKQNRNPAIYFENHVPSLNSPLVRMDAVRLQQILRHLFGNALKFSEQGTISVSCERRDDAIAITVKDEGIGISKENLKLIFELFMQVDGSESRQYGGTGLGLTLTKELVEFFGGSLSVVSEQGKGSAFTLTLPNANKS